MIMDDDNIQSDGESESGHEVTTRMRRFRGVLREMMLRHSLKLVQQDLYRSTELSIIMRNESSLLKSAPSMKGREIQDADFCRLFCDNRKAALFTEDPNLDGGKLRYKDTKVVGNNVEELQTDEFFFSCSTRNVHYKEDAIEDTSISVDREGRCENNCLNIKSDRNEFLESSSKDFLSSIPDSNVTNDRHDVSYSEEASSTNDDSCMAYTDSTDAILPEINRKITKKHAKAVLELAESASEISQSKDRIKYDEASVKRNAHVVLESTESLFDLSPLRLEADQFDITSRLPTTVDTEFCQLTNTMPTESSTESEISSSKINADSNILSFELLNKSISSTISSDLNQYTNSSETFLSAAITMGSESPHRSPVVIALSQGSFDDAEQKQNQNSVQERIDPVAKSLFPYSNDGPNIATQYHVTPSGATSYDFIGNNLLAQLQDTPTNKDSLANMKESSKSSLGGKKDLYDKYNKFLNKDSEDCGKVTVTSSSLSQKSKDSVAGKDFDLFAIQLHGESDSSFSDKSSASGRVKEPFAGDELLTPSQYFGELTTIVAKDDPMEDDSLDAEMIDLESSRRMLAEELSRVDLSVQEELYSIRETIALCLELKSQNNKVFSPSTPIPHSKANKTSSCDRTTPGKQKSSCCTPSPSCSKFEDQNEDFHPQLTSSFTSKANQSLSCEISPSTDQGDFQTKTPPRNRTSKIPFYSSRNRSSESRHEQPQTLSTLHTVETSRSNGRRFVPPTSSVAGCYSSPDRSTTLSPSNRLCSFSTPQSISLFSRMPHDAQSTVRRLKKLSQTVDKDISSVDTIRMCSKKFIFNSHHKKGPCHRCWSLASGEVREQYKTRRRHLRISTTKGGCDRSCAIFPAHDNGGVPVRLCRQCFFATHQNENGLQVYRNHMKVQPTP